MNHFKKQNRLGTSETFAIKNVGAIALALSSIYPMLAQAQAQVQAAEEVVVTASRISRAGFTAPTPTTEVGAQDFQNKAAVTITDVLFDLPAVRSGGGGNIGLTTSGGNYLNLRNLNVGNSSRTLVLVDGRRFVPTGTFGAVDTNVVPAGLVQSVEVVTGGASAAWGSDAVAGVANVILKKRISGFEGNIQGGASQKGDAKNYAGTLAWGTGFADDRGQFMIGSEYSKVVDGLRAKDRDWANTHLAYVPETINGVSYTRSQAAGLTLSGLTTGGVLVNSNGSPLASTSPLYGKQFITAAANSVPYNYGTVRGNIYAQGGDGGWIYDQSALTTPLERKTVYARSTFDFTDKLSGFAEASYASSAAETDLFLESLPSNTGTVNRTSTTIPLSVPTAVGASPGAVEILRGNPYIPADIAAIMTANNINAIYLGRITPEWGSWHTNNKTTTKRYALGLNGNFGETGSWKSYLTQGISHFDIVGSNNPIMPNLSAALDVVQGPNGPICRINSTLASDIAITSSQYYAGYGASPGCVPANPFGNNSLANVKNYIVGTLTNFQTYKQSAAGLSAQGEPFSNWVGPVSLAGGLEYRKETLNQVVDAVSDLRTRSYAGGGFQQNNPKSFGGEETVREAFAETVVPLLANVPFVKTLDFNAAVRRTDYKSSGLVTTWKGGLTYVPFTGLLFRGTRSRDIRAATLREQNLGAFSYAGVIDRRPGSPTFGQTVQWSQIDTGTSGIQKLYPNLPAEVLIPEIGDTVTIGATWTPADIKGLAVSLDYFNIKIQKSIEQQSIQTTMDRCFGAGTYAGQPADASQCIYLDFSTNTFVHPYLNLGKASTRGVDLEVSYRLALNSLMAGMPGSMTFRTLASYLDKRNTTPVGGVPAEASGAGSDGHLRLTVSSAYQNGPWNWFLQARYLDQTRISNTLLAATDFANGNSIPSVTYVNTSLQYTIYDKSEKGTLQVYGNINNLFDRKPPTVLSTGPTFAGQGIGGSVSNYGYYDVIGRAFVVGLRFKY